MTEVKKANLQSMNIPEDKLRQLKQIFPEAFTEGLKVDLDKLRLSLGENVDAGRERFGMNWPGKADCFKIIQAPSVATLIPARDESINFDTTENLFIEGDNLEVLKLLQKSYYGKVKLIYIDPPYNTGDDFIYPDNYTETLDTYLKYTGQIDSEGRKYSTNSETDGRFHSKWLNMMYPRLYAARNLMCDDGAILLHIDEHEQNNCNALMNEIFGEENSLGIIIWDKRNPKGDARGIAYQHETLFLYAKNKEHFLAKNELVRLKKNASEILSKARELFQKKSAAYGLDVVNVDFAEWIKNNKKLSGGEAAYNRIDDNGDVYQSVSMAWPNKKKAPDEYFQPLIHPLTKKPCSIPARGWRNPPETMRDLMQKKLVIFGADETVQPRRKYLLKENMYENLPSIFPFGGSDDALLAELKITFDNPKPYEFAKEMIRSLVPKEGIILDFFAGSGTVAHAVLDLNLEGVSRQFICVQLPEECDDKSDAKKAGFQTIAEVAKERIRRVIKKIYEEQKNNMTKEKLLFDDGKNASSPDIGFKVFKLTRSNFKVWEGSVDPKKDVVEKQLVMHVDHINFKSSQDDILFELLLKAGFELTTKIEKVPMSGKSVYSIEGGLMLICLEKELTQDVIKAMAEKNPSRVICLDQGFAGNDQLKTNAVQIMKSKGVEDFRTV